MSYDLMGRGWTARPIVRAGGPGMKAHSALAAALAIALALAACGKEGPPTPPLRAVPAPVKDLAVRQRGTHVLLSFTYPQTTPGGAALNGVTKVEVYEAVLQPPPPLKTPAKAPDEKKPGGGKAAATTAPEAGKAGAKATATGAATADHSNSSASTSRSTDRGTGGRSPPSPSMPRRTPSIRMTARSPTGGQTTSRAIRRPKK